MNVTSWSHINVSCYMINNIILSNLSVQIDTNYGHVEQKKYFERLTIFGNKTDLLYYEVGRWNSYKFLIFTHITKF